uniref:Pygopus family PHD finger 2 n=1 Tax=Amazona collaria TaxID=241587 RepID=A0A8B9GKU1_9PSIT
MAAPHAEKLEGGVPAPPPPPGPPHPAGSAATGGPGRKQGKAGLQMKSPEKKRRKSNTQGPAYSHLSEFAPPPTPMVDHLVASNPFEDDFAAPKAGAAAAAAASFLGSPVPFGGFRVQAGMSPQVPPGYGGGPQPLRRQPPPFAPGQMGPAFSMAPQGPGYGQPGAVGFPGQPFGQPLGPSFSPPGAPLLQGPVGGFGPMISPTLGQPPRGDVGPGPALNAPPGGPAVGQRFGQPGGLFGQSPLQRPGQGGPPLPPTASPFPGADPGFPPGGEEGGKSLNPPPGAFAPEQHSGSPAAVNGAQPGFTPGSTGRGAGTPETNSLPPPPPGKAAGGSGHQPPPGLVYPCGACRNEVNDDQDAILCEASCQKWFHRECTGMTENAYGLLTTEASAVWACDFCLKTKEIQSVYVREGLGQLVAANDG